MGSLIGNNQNQNQVYYDPQKGQYYTESPIDYLSYGSKQRNYLGEAPGMFASNNAPVQQRTPLTPRAGVGPSMQSIYGGAVQPQTNPYPGGPTPPRPSFLPQFDMNAVLARARMANPTQAPQRPSFMARPSMNMAPQQPVGNPNSGIAALPNMTQGK